MLIVIHLSVISLNSVLAFNTFPTSPVISVSLRASVFSLCSVFLFHHNRSKNKFFQHLILTFIFLPSLYLPLDIFFRYMLDVFTLFKHFACFVTSAFVRDVWHSSYSISLTLSSWFWLSFHSVYRSILSVIQLCLLVCLSIHSYVCTYSNVMFCFFQFFFNFCFKF